MIRNVEWVSCNRLSCCGATPAIVILCVRNGIVLPTNDPDFPLATVQATLISCSQVKCGCNSNYRYVFSYEDSLLVPGTILYQSDINGVVCEGCMTQWVRELVGNETSVTSFMGEELIVSDAVAGQEYPPVDTILASGSLAFTNPLLTSSVNAQFIVNFPQSQFSFDSNDIPGMSLLDLAMEISTDGVVWTTVGRTELSIQVPTTTSEEFHDTTFQHYTHVVQVVLAPEDVYTLYARVRVRTVVDEAGQALFIFIPFDGKISMHATTI